MTVRVSALDFKARITHNTGGVVGKLFLCVLGLEYPIDFKNGGIQPFDVFGMTSNTKPTADKLIYNYINRTNNESEFAYSDGVLPVYIRFQPDVSVALDTAASGVPSGALYASQWIDLDEPDVSITGREATVDDNGAIVYKDTTVNYVIPVNPPDTRKVRLSVQDGLMIFLAKIR